MAFQTVNPKICTVLIFYKRIWDSLLQHILCIIFQEKSFSCYILLTDQMSLSAFTSWDIGHYEYCNQCCTVCDVINFEINLSFLIEPFFYITKNKDKNINISRTKIVFNMKYKAFCHFKELSWKQILFLESGSPTLRIKQ